MRTSVFLLVATFALAEDPAAARLSVSGEGVAVRPATEARVFLRATGQAEEAKEAKVKHKEKVDKILAALKGLGIQETDVAVHAPSLVSGQGDANAIAAAMMRGGGRTDQSSGLVSVLGAIEVKVAATADVALFDRAAAALDVVIEAGADNLSSDARQYYNGGAIELNGPPSPLVLFVVGDVAAMREEAFGKAVEEARAESALLAGRLGVKAGRILSAAAEADATAYSSQDPLAAELAEAVKMSAEGPWRLSADAVGLRPTVSRSVRVHVELAIEP